MHTHTHIFRTDHLILENQLMCSSMGRSISLTINEKGGNHDFEKKRGIWEVWREEIKTGNGGYITSKNKI